MTPPTPHVLDALARYALLSPLFEGRRVLDIGTDTALTARALAEAGVAEATLLTHDATALATELADLGIEGIALGEDAELPLRLEDGAVDVVICHDLSQRLARDPAWRSEIRRVLAPEGYLVAAVANPQGEHLGQLWGATPPGSPLTYEELWAHLAEDYTAGAMYAQLPLGGHFFYDVGSEEEDPDPSLDRSLVLADEEQPGWYVLVFGPERQGRDDYAIVQLDHTLLASTSQAGRAPLAAAIPDDVEVEVGEMHASAAAFEASRAEIEQLRAQLEEAERAAREHADLQEHTRAQLTELQHTLTAREHADNSTAAEIQRLTALVARLEEDLVQAEHQQRESTRHDLTLRSELDVHQAELKAARASLESAHGESEQQRADATRLAAEAQHLRDELDNQGTEAQALRDEIAQLQGQLETLRRDAAHAESAAKEHEARAIRAEEAAAQQRQHLSGETERLRALAVRLEQDVGQRTQRVSALEHQVTTLQREHNEAQQRVREGLVHVPMLHALLVNAEQKRHETVGWAQHVERHLLRLLGEEQDKSVTLATQRKQSQEELSTLRRELEAAIQKQTDLATQAAEGVARRNELEESLEASKSELRSAVTAHERALRELEEHLTREAEARVEGRLQEAEESFARREAALREQHEAGRAQAVQEHLAQHEKQLHQQSEARVRQLRETLEEERTRLQGAFAKERQEHLQRIGELERLSARQRNDMESFQVQVKDLLEEVAALRHAAKSGDDLEVLQRRLVAAEQELADHKQALLQERTRNEQLRHELSASLEEATASDQAPLANQPETPVVESDDVVTLVDPLPEVVQAGDRATSSAPKSPAKATSDVDATLDGLEDLLSSALPQRPPQ